MDEERINQLAQIARRSGAAAIGTADGRSILTLAAAAYGARPQEEATSPTGYDPFAAALFEAIIEGAYLVATADGVFDDEERRTFERIVAAASGGMISQRTAGELVTELAEHLRNDGLERRIQRLIERTTRPEQGREVLRIAALVACASDEVSAVEREMLMRIATAFRLDAAAVEAAIVDAKAYLIK